MRQIEEKVSGVDSSYTAPEIAREIFHIVREESGRKDPFRRERQEQNSIALDLLSRMESMVSQASNPWLEALKLSIAGNAIDLGVYSHLSRDEIEKSILGALDVSLNAEAASQLKDEIDNAESVLFLGDNAGEIVFDMLLIKQMSPQKLCYVVRGGPVLNDVIYDDAIQVGMDKLVEVIDNGYDVPGTKIEKCSKSFQDRFNKADLILAKGQGNYETLSEVNKNIFFLFKVKCPSIAEDSGFELGSFAIKKK